MAVCTDVQAALLMIHMVCIFDYAYVFYVVP